jgi:hypothetical protein
LTYKKTGSIEAFQNFSFGAGSIFSIFSLFFAAAGAAEMITEGTQKILFQSRLTKLLKTIH